MKQLISFLNLISNIGVNSRHSYLKQKEVELSNRISLILIPISIAGLLISYFREVYFTSLGFGILSIFLICTFFLNRNGKSIVSRFTLSILPPIFLLLPNVLGGIGKAENYLAFSYLFLAFTFIPLLLFHDKKNFLYLALALIINLLIVVFFDAFLVWGERSRIDIQLIEDNYIYFKMPQVILWLLIVGAFQFVKSENVRSEKRLKKANASLHQLNNEFRMQNDKIIFQNQILDEYQVKTEKQTNKLKSQNYELENTKLELLNAIDNLKELKEKFLDKEAVTKSVFDALNEHYLVAQYDLNGNLNSVNTKVIELLGVLQDEHFQNIKHVINESEKNQNGSINEPSFDKLWKRIVNGEAQTIELDFKIGNKTISLATTFAPLFDARKCPYRILAIGHNVSELKEIKVKIDSINDELKEKLFEISQQNELLSFQQREIFDKSEKLHHQKEENKR